MMSTKMTNLSRKLFWQQQRKQSQRGRRRNYQLYWSPELDNLETILNDARREMKISPTDENVEAHNRDKASYTRKKLQETRDSWHSMTASLKMEKDRPGC